ncbi:MAG: DNA repair protein RecN [Candidatus Aminicenantes bacterium]|nr:DNA repair protein RecN [Candidatus Aminicenantes bacterium]
MLSFLKVENLAVVEKVGLDFSEHLNILTGETGAGKSILIDAIMLLINKKTPANIVRNGTQKLTIEALFVHQDEEIILKREISKSKSLTYLNGELVPFSMVKEKAEVLLNIYGQKDHIFLLNTANHQIFLDRFAQHGGLLTALAEKSRSLRGLQARRNELQAKSGQAREKIDYIDFQLHEIESLDLHPGDEQAWQERLKILAAAESILEKSEVLVQDFYQKDQSVYNLLARDLSSAAYLGSLFPEFNHLKDEIDHFFNLLPEISGFLSNLAGKVDYNENELNEISEKLSRLEKLKAKHKLSLEQLLEKYKRMRQEKDELLNLNFSLTDVEKEIACELAEYKILLAQLRESRRKNASELSTLIVKELSFLEMEKARFEVRMEENEPNPENISETGPDKIEFYFSSNPGQTLGRLKDVASGGELSRLMLVLKSISGDESGATFIFDEIDSGIGGKTAEFVGEKLRKISAQNQVISISHLPQIARFADRHFLINKEFKNNQTYSTAQVLENSARVREIARLMAGSAINADVLKAAELLLARSKV